MPEGTLLTSTDHDELPGRDGISREEFLVFIEEQIGELRSEVKDLIPENSHPLQGLRNLCFERIRTLRRECLLSGMSLLEGSAITHQRQVGKLCESISERVEDIVDSIKHSKPYRKKTAGLKFAFQNSEARVYDQVARLFGRKWRKVRRDFHDRYNLISEESEAI
ncbi:hypothetical protein A2974_02970 [Candidatus Peregrinibacteria bacterium RIFCSPLOWO2_01_FULL_48_20]|nr:MAG: hypothetical protein A2974_02970 [Candidatus Peregrinibacteria bacterium RIFCSPLOWO2_01_FULL_48_20]